MLWQRMTRALPPISRLLRSPWLHIALIIIIAAFFRLWRIGSIPPGLFGDEATDGLDALDVLAGRGAIFFPANFGREGLHMWIVAGMFRLIGVTPLALRLPSVVVGILTALATYWLGRELVGTSARRYVGGGNTWKSPSQAANFLPLLAALYLATSYWHVHFSRFGIRGVFTPFFGALAFAAFWRGINHANQHIGTSANRQTPQPTNPPIRWLRGYTWFIISGLCLGLALHFYTASRFFPFFLGGFLVLELLIAWARGRRGGAASETAGQPILQRHFWGIVVLFVVAMLVFAPLGIYFLQHPGSFMQRAGEVTAFRAGNPWLRMGEAAVANVLQFFVPGRGDPEQFYNLPRRAVFDPLTAILALIGMGVLLWRWREPAALFLLAWFPALLLPAFLATDRWPTLPRVLGVIPGVYFFPAVGAVAVVTLLARLWVRVAAIGDRPKQEALLRQSLTVLLALVLLVHAGGTYRDYFRIWGPAQATFDAFEGDMTAAWNWLRNNRAEGHVYLSSDIYRHPTFMLLGERATVQTYFQHTNPDLSWYDARSALPLPPPGEPATYLIGASAGLAERAAAILGDEVRVRDHVPAPDGSATLQVLELGPTEDRLGEIRLATGARFSPIRFTDHLTLVNLAWATTATDRPELILIWRTSGPDPTGWSGYRLEIAGQRGNGDAWQDDLPFDAFRSPEWTSDGRFITWHALNVPDAKPLRTLRLRLLSAATRSPLLPVDAADGWHAIPIE